MSLVFYICKLQTLAYISCGLGWSEELAIDAWTNDRAGACEKAGITTEEESDGLNQLTSLGVHKVSTEREREREREREM